MKKIIICLFIFAIGYTANAQRFRQFDKDWKVGIGVNAVGSLGSRNPVKGLDKYAFRFPLAVSVERQLTEEFAFEQDLSLNGFNKGNTIDGIGIKSVNQSFMYFSTNSNLKWYFGDYLFEADWLDLYVSGGLGIFYMEELNGSANLSAGVQYWFNDNIGLRLQSTGKFAFNPDNYVYANNHFQHVLQVVFRL